MATGKQQIIGAITASVLLGASAACGGGGTVAVSTDDATQAVRVMMFPGQAYRLPIMLAEQEGIFKKHGIKIDVVAQPGNLQGVQGLIATKSQVGQLTVGTLGQGWQAGSKAAFFCGGIDVLQTTLMAAPASKLPATSDGATWQEVLQSLKGKKIGIQTPVGSGLQLIFAAALKEAGVTDVTYVNLGGASTVAQAALKNGSVDVAQTNPPATQFFLSQKAGKPLMYMSEGPETYKGYYGSGWAAPTEWLQKNPKTAAAFCDAFKEGLAFVKNPANAEASKAMMEKDMGVTPAVAGLILQNGVFNDFSGDLSEQTLNTTFDAYVKLGVLKADPKPDYASLVVIPKP